MKHTHQKLCVKTNYRAWKLTEGHPPNPPNTVSQSFLHKDLLKERVHRVPYERGERKSQWGYLMSKPQPCEIWILIKEQTTILRNPGAENCPKIYILCANIYFTWANDCAYLRGAGLQAASPEMFQSGNSGFLCLCERQDNGAILILIYCETIRNSLTSHSEGTHI